MTTTYQLPSVSIIIPAHNEEKNIRPLFDRLAQVLQHVPDYEIIWIDDGSTDGTYRELLYCSGVTVIRFRRRFGQTAALSAGFQRAQFPICVTLDSDLQNDPSDIVRLVQYLEEEKYDVVSGWRKERFDSVSKNAVSYVGRVIRYLFINDGVRDSGCTLKAYRTECVRDLDLFGEMHRFIPALLKIKGYRIGELSVTHHKRFSGSSHYNWTRLIKASLDFISVWFWKKFHSRPLHLFGGMGVLLLMGCMVASVYLVYIKIWSGVDLSDTILTYVVLFLSVLGVQFIIFGLLSDILVRIYYAVSNRTYYEIVDIQTVSASSKTVHPD